MSAATQEQEDRREQSAQSDMKSDLTIYQVNWLMEFKRQNALLERIAQALEDIQVNISEVAAK
jgi:hypothetical protein